MRTISIVALIAVFVGVVSAGEAVANSGGMGDPSAHMRRIEEVCQAQRRGEYPPYPNVCPSWYVDRTVRR